MKNVNFNRVELPFASLSDGSPRYLPIDTFPVSDESFINASGFPSSELTILDRFSRSQLMDDDYIKKVAARIEQLPEPPKNDLTLSQEIRTLRPAWCQTPSEYAEYSERVYQILSSDKVVAKEVDIISKEKKVDVPLDSSPSDSSDSPAA